jgi:universal protein Kae1
VGIVELQEETGKAKILANLWKMYAPAEGGIHPREAANHHALHLPSLISAALNAAKVSYRDLSLVGFSQGPGLGPCLRTVSTAARALALSLKLPLVGVNHCIAHLEVGALTGASDPILLYVSGGNTQVIAYVNNRYRVFGETLDIALGNMFDKFGRAAKLHFPAGPEIERYARQGTNYIPLPYSVKGMDVAFSGILTYALKLLRTQQYPLADLCYSLQETCFAMLTEVTERAMAHTGKSEVLLGGGVAQNKRLQKMVEEMATSRGAEFYVPPSPLCVDNGAMIAYTALLMHRAGISLLISESHVKQRFRTDEVEVVWRR